MAGYGTYEFAGGTAYYLLPSLLKEHADAEYWLLYTRGTYGDHALYFEPYNSLAKLQERLDHLALLRPDDSWSPVGVLKRPQFRAIEAAEIVKSWKVED